MQRIEPSTVWIVFWGYIWDRSHAQHLADLATASPGLRKEVSDSTIEA
jgi:hypothetical protein